MNTSTGTVLVVFAICISYYLRERRLTRLAKAKLDLSTAVSEMEQHLLNGRVTAGEVCHDDMFKAMLRCQEATRVRWGWKLWRMPTESEQQLREQFMRELKANSHVGEISGRFVRSAWNVYENQRPFASRCFILWCFIFGGMLNMLVLNLRSFLQILRALVSFKRNWGTYVALCDPVRLTVALWLVAFCGSNHSRHNTEPNCNNDSRRIPQAV